MYLLTWLTVCEFVFIDVELNVQPHPLFVELFDGVDFACLIGINLFMKDFRIPSILVESLRSALIRHSNYTISIHHAYLS